MSAVEWGGKEGNHHASMLVRASKKGDHIVIVRLTQYDAFVMLPP